MRIVHILADGTELSSLDGFVVERDKNTEVYESLIKSIERETEPRNKIM